MTILFHLVKICTNLNGSQISVRIILLTKLWITPGVGGGDKEKNSRVNDTLTTAVAHSFILISKSTANEVYNNTSA